MVHSQATAESRYGKLYICFLLRVIARVQNPLSVSFKNWHSVSYRNANKDFILEHDTVETSAPFKQISSQR